MTIKELLNNAEINSERAGKEFHPARLLLMDILDIESYQLYAMLEEEMLDEKVAEFTEKYNRYLIDNEPIQYILGYEYFAGRNIFVDDRVLIPRPETEELVHELLFLIDDHFGDKEVINACDVGTGSGAIAISLAAEDERINMIATDISEVALEVAKKNAESYAPSVQFFAGNMIEPLIENAKAPIDLFVSNPPYIPQNENVEAIVKDNEPHVALFGGEDGLDFYRVIFENASTVLAEKNIMAFEIGWDQKEILLSLVKEYFPKSHAYVNQDMQGKDRMLFIFNGIKAN